jgi:hypothetical protein
VSQLEHPGACDMILRLLDRIHDLFELG